MAARTILIADDEPSVLELAAQVLMRTGFKVLTARDGLQGIDILEKAGKSVSLLLTDFQMPRADGIHLAKVARGINPALPIIIMSGYAPTDSILQAVEDWDAQFMSKPFSIQKLEETVLGAFSEVQPN